PNVPVGEQKRWHFAFCRVAATYSVNRNSACSGSNTQGGVSRSWIAACTPRFFAALGWLRGMNPGCIRDSPGGREWGGRRGRCNSAEGAGGSWWGLPMGASVVDAARLQREQSDPQGELGQDRAVAIGRAVGEMRGAVAVPGAQVVALLSQRDDSRRLVGARAALLGDPAAGMADPEWDQDLE